ncbi:MAG: hypothetical protein HUJ57_09395, partial [Erysipelotrichaceae bacterium]|nr:hypothetical protein [Erysipelotrichaceae bacterium]
MTDPKAVPDDAEFKVTQVTDENLLDVYLAAANTGNGEAEFTKENSLLYDIAFLVDKLDEEGNKTGEKYEYQPEKGKVKIDIKFKKSQVTDQLDVSKEEEVIVMHLPLKEEVKESVDKTLDATEIKPEDVIVEVVDAQVTVNENAADEIKMDLESLSMVIIGPDGTEGNIVSGTDFSTTDMLGDARYFGVTTRKFNSDNHMDSNLATYEYYGTNDFTPGTYNNQQLGGEVLIGKVINGGKIKITSGTPQKITLGSNITTDQYEITNPRDQVIVRDSDTNIKARIENMINGVDNNMQDIITSNSSNINKITSSDNGEETIDIKSLGPGTYYFEVEEGPYYDWTTGQWTTKNVLHEKKL